MAAGYEITCGVQTDASLWCWGSGYQGRDRAQETSATRSRPHQIGLGQSWQGRRSGLLPRLCCDDRRDSVVLGGATPMGRSGTARTRSRMTPQEIGSAFPTGRSPGVGWRHSCARTPQWRCLVLGLQPSTASLGNGHHHPTRRSPSRSSRADPRATRYFGCLRLVGGAGQVPRWRPPASTVKKEILPSVSRTARSMSLSRRDALLPARRP